MPEDFEAQETTAARADFLVELRGFEPLTSAVRLQFPWLGGVCSDLPVIDKRRSYNG
jgi:hypothetical protein